MPLLSLLALPPSLSNHHFVFILKSPHHFSRDDFPQPPPQALSTGRSGTLLGKQSSGQAAHKVSESRGVPCKVLTQAAETVGKYLHDGSATEVGGTGMSLKFSVKGILPLTASEA